MKWNEARIREELERLDKLTGLHGNALPVSFGKARNTLGCFVTCGGEPKAFRFSKVYFGSDAFSQHEAYDVIRHEYAHYMNHVLHGGAAEGAHGALWRDCCRRIGANPSPYYDPMENEVHLCREREQEKIQKALDALDAGLQLGDRVRHPKFGEGCVFAMERTPKDVRVVIDFASGERKTLSGRWVAENCLPSSAEG